LGVRIAVLALHGSSGQQQGAHRSKSQHHDRPPRVSFVLSFDWASDVKSPAQLAVTDTLDMAVGKIPIEEIFVSATRQLQGDWLSRQ
jgi:hypothetical protein